MNIIFNNVMYSLGNFVVSVKLHILSNCEKTIYVMRLIQATVNCVPRERGTNSSGLSSRFEIFTYPDLSIALHLKAISKIDTFKSDVTLDFATCINRQILRAKICKKSLVSQRGPFVCVKKGFAVDIAAYITHVIDDGDPSGSLQPVISCTDWERNIVSA